MTDQDCIVNHNKALLLIKDASELYVTARITGDVYNERMAFQRLQRAIENYYRGQNN